MTQFIPFDTALINPDNVYRIDRVTDTVTFTLLVGSVPPTDLIEQDFVFGSEALAITALDDFATASEKGQLTLAECFQAVVVGALANTEITKGALKNTNLGSIDVRTDALVSQLESIALKIKADFDALVLP